MSRGISHDTYITSQALPFSQLATSCQLPSVTLQFKALSPISHALLTQRSCQRSTWSPPSVPIRPEDKRPSLGFEWDGKFYMDAIVPVGCSSSCTIFKTFSHALEWIASTNWASTKWFTSSTIFCSLQNHVKSVRRT